MAKEFGVSKELMQQFLNKFSPYLVAENTFASTADTMLFIHIPKTAGVSLGKSFNQAFDIFYGVQWNDIAKSFRQATRDAAYRQSQGQIRQVIMGHYGWPELQIWRNHEMPMKCGTVLRDPIARVISNYNYNCSEAHPAHGDFKQRFPTLNDFVKGLQPDVQITQALGMVNSFETILTKLLAHYTFLGITEDLPSSLAHLGRSHGLKHLKEHRQNVGLIPAPAQIPDDLRRKIEAQSYNDLKLHRLLTRIYGG